MLWFIYLFILASSSQTWPWTSDPHVFISQVLGFQESVPTSAWFPKLRVNDLNCPHPLEAEQTNHRQLKSRKGTRGGEEKKDLENSQARCGGTSCKPNTWGARAEELAWVWGQSRLHADNLFQNSIKKNAAQACAPWLRIGITWEGLRTSK